MSSQSSSAEIGVVSPREGQDLAPWREEMNRLRTEVAAATADSQQKTHQIVSLAADIAAIKLQVQQLSSSISDMMEKKADNVAMDVFDARIREKVGNAVAGQQVANDFFEQHVGEIIAVVGQKVANTILEQHIGEINTLVEQKVAHNLFEERIGEIILQVGQKVDNDVLKQHIGEINTLVEQKVADNLFEERIGEIILQVGQKVDNNVFEQRIGEINAVVGQTVPIDFFEQRVEEINAVFEQRIGEINAVVEQKVTQNLLEERIEQKTLQVGQKVDNNVFEQRIGEINAVLGRRSPTISASSTSDVGEVIACVERKVTDEHLGRYLLGRVSEFVFFNVCSFFFTFGFLKVFFDDILQPLFWPKGLSPVHLFTIIIFISVGLSCILCFVFLVASAGPIIFIILIANSFFRFSSE
eukprot:TRINITY_DN8000_c0_g1_i4.p1 TRINITY_DN8000_c0_g1~~TRINITY_DN8000_c0_g1_i4.p1  ORF type:complete len:413 (+),score=97.38 TRINITY_DN8000_c0_g1_i4:113-1351(+)